MFEKTTASRPGGPVASLATTISCLRSGTEVEKKKKNMGRRRGKMTPLKTDMAGWKITMFNRRYILICFFLVHPADSAGFGKGGRFCRMPNIDSWKGCRICKNGRVQTGKESIASVHKKCGRVVELVKTDSEKSVVFKVLCNRLLRYILYKWSMLRDVDVSCTCTHGRCYTMLTS